MTDTYWINKCGNLEAEIERLRAENSDQEEEMKHSMPPTRAEQYWKEKAESAEAEIERLNNCATEDIAEIVKREAEISELKKAIAAEREACAKIAEKVEWPWTPKRFAAAIRNRVKQN